MKIVYELEQGYIDVWNEESEEWDRYIKIEKKSVVEEEKKIPEKISVWYEFNATYDKELTKIMLDELKDKYNEIIDYLQGKGE